MACEAGRRAVLAGGVGPCVQLLQSSQEAVQRHALSILEHVAADRQTDRQTDRQIIGRASGGHLRPHGGRQRVRRTHPWVEAETDKGEADLGGGMREAHLDT